MAKAKFFDNKRLIKKHGSWVRAMIAFYDFIFVCMGDCKSKGQRSKCKKMREAIENGDWHKEGITYEHCVNFIDCLPHLKTFEDAWDIFLKSEKLKPIGKLHGYDETTT